MILGVSGKMQSGKDEVARMWQYVAQCHIDSFTDISYVDYRDHCNLVDSGITKDDWQVKYWAGKLRTFISDITGISIEDLMKDSVKNTVLPQWNKTPRELLQKIGTDVCRVVDEDFHVIALMCGYKYNLTGEYTEVNGHSGIIRKLPNWIIPDTRFHNEYGCIIDHSGVVIRVERSWRLRYPELLNRYTDNTSHSTLFEYMKVFEQDLYTKHTHPSETELDNVTFTHTIYNNGTLEELLDEVETIYNIIYG